MRQIHNVHERVIEAPVDTVAALFDRVSSADDPVFPTPAWPPMRFDRPLSVGAVGGHGRIRYSVVCYEPGRRARFAFTPPANGYHELSVEHRGANASLVRHVLEQRPDLASWLAWVLVVRWAHNVIIEEVLDNFERAATGSLRRTTRWPVWVRLLHRLRAERPVAVSIPSGARLARGAFERVDFSDAWQVELRPGVTHDLECWRGPMRFPVVARSSRELLLGKDGSALSFRVSIHLDQGHATLSTVVQAHTPLGRLFLAIARRGHPHVVRSLLRRGYHRLMLEAPTAAERELVAAGHPLPEAPEAPVARRIDLVGRSSKASNRKPPGYRCRQSILGMPPGDERPTTDSPTMHPITKGRGHV